MLSPCSNTCSLSFPLHHEHLFAVKHESEQLFA